MSLHAVQASVVACRRCTRLRAYCTRIAREKKRAHRDDVYWDRPVPGFGDPDARLLLVGLAPAAHGANRTGRVFTGDGSGDFLVHALHRAGFANMPTSQRADDGLVLTDAYVLSAVRCAPPDNKPTPEEILNCLPHFAAEFDALPRVSVIVALGKIGFDACLRLFRTRGIVPRPRPVFAHGSVYRFQESRHSREGGNPGWTSDRLPLLIGCYHPSRQNTNTGKLTPEMMDRVFLMVRRMIGRK